MDTLIYSASPWKAVSGSLFLVAFCFVLGLLSLLPAVFSRKGKIIKRIVTAGLGALLLLVGIAMSFSTYHTYQNGNKTVYVRAVEKREIVTRCNETYCTEYSVETTDGEKFYVFGLSKGTWEDIKVDVCYAFTYYPLRPLLADYLQEENQIPSLYETTGYITLIEQVTCQ